MRKVSEFEAFDKTVKVILSCKTAEQLKAAERYIELFYDMFPFPSRLPEDAIYRYIETLNDRQNELIKNNV